MAWSWGQGLCQREAEQLLQLRGACGVFGVTGRRDRGTAEASGPGTDILGWIMIGKNRGDQCCW